MIPVPELQPARMAAEPRTMTSDAVRLGVLGTRAFCARIVSSMVRRKNTFSLSGIVVQSSDPSSRVGSFVALKNRNTNIPASCCSRRVHKWTRLEDCSREGRSPPLVREVNSRTSPPPAAEPLARPLKTCPIDGQVFSFSNSSALWTSLSPSPPERGCSGSVLARRRSRRPWPPAPRA